MTKTDRLMWHPSIVRRVHSTLQNNSLSDFSRPILQPISTNSSASFASQSNRADSTSGDCLDVGGSKTHAGHVLERKSDGFTNPKDESRFLNCNNLTASSFSPISALSSQYA